MPYHKIGAYDGFDRVAEVKKHYRRCRTIKHFIFSDQAVSSHKFTCAHCRYPITIGSGNRCQYFPSINKIAVMHYVCAWENVLNHIFKKERLI